MTSSLAALPARHAIPHAARTTLALLQRLQHGTLAVQLPNGALHCFGSGSAPHAAIRLHNWKLFGAVFGSGDIGLAECYRDQDWSTADLPALLALLIGNRAALEDLVYGRWTGRLFYRLRHLLHRNTRRNSARNIQAHYDLGNPFYGLWLDETMSYSAALFEGRAELPLADAQRAKMRRALRMAGVGAGDRLLEIGCGWGALAELAATECAALVTGVTVSQAQLAAGRQRVAGLNVELRLQDYRDIVDPPFDAICSIEMVEAVGREYWPAYFGAVSRLLKPGGRACIQSIVIHDRLWHRYIRSTDFIQQYIFPGGCLPCPAEFRQQAVAAGLQVEDEQAFGADYAETLRRWRTDFLRQREQVQSMGFDDRFVRLWEFYLAYCEAAFAQGDIDVVQFTLRKPALAA